MLCFAFQVSGDKPVFVESVKPNGAAHKAGLIASDMILEVIDWLQVEEEVEVEKKEKVSNDRPIPGQWQSGAILDTHGRGEVDKR